MSASRAVLARMEAAEMAVTFTSPFTMARHLNTTAGEYRPSVQTSDGSMPSDSTARRMASRLARRMLMVSISSTLATATDQASARSRISSARRSRAASVRTLESASPSMGLAGSRTTAAAKTLPASGPRPASSTPHSSAGTGGKFFGTGIVGVVAVQVRRERLGDALIMTFRERFVKAREARPPPLARHLVVQPVAQRLGEVARRRLFLEQLRDDEL